ncbi:MAG: histidine kinase, partial [Rhodospirillales bacterium]|nr:histidine kinase [Rhodospirillales bacterium]
GDGPLTVRGIDLRLSQVFQNLIDNALSFSPPETMVTVSAKRDGDWVAITVEDRGPGIPADNLDNVFERFYTARPEGEAFGRHSGLGLSIARQIVEAHGGTLRAGNREPTGSEPEGVKTAHGAKFVVRLRM